MGENGIRAMDEPLPPASKALSLYMVGAIALALGIVLTILVAAVLSWNDKPVPSEMWQLAAICATALAGMFGYERGKASA